jgi:hypothetical protein
MIKDIIYVYEKSQWNISWNWYMLIKIYDKKLKDYQKKRPPEITNKNKAVFSFVS